jgi:molybdopterin-guanine dinucleotide biosynthesis protein A
MTGDAHLPHHGAPLTLGAVVLAGGGGARMGGVDKASIEVDGVTLLERTLAAVMAAGEVVVVGSEQVPTSRPVTWTREEPPGGGPAAGLLAGLSCFVRPPQVVAVTAVDMPRLNAGTIARLTWAVEASPDVDAAVLRDAGGRRQWLAAVYRWSALQAARPADLAAEHGLPMHRLVAALRVVEVAAVGEEARDVDTLADLAALRDPGNHPTGDITG